MNFRIQFIPEAVKDYQSLDGSIKKKVNDKIEKLKKNPFLGDALGNKNGIDLTGFYKIYLSKKVYRIVYRILKEKLEIIEILDMGKRDKLEIYNIIKKRKSTKT